MLRNNLILASLFLTSWGQENVKLRRDEKPGFPTDPNTVRSCTWWYDNDGSIPCNDMPAAWAISLETFRRWNPSITAQCGGFEVGRSYCVEAFGEPPPVTTSSIPSSTGSPTSTGGPPGPTQPGQVPNCNRWDLVKDGDNCGTFINKYPGLTLKDLYTWNTGVGDQCQFLWKDTYLCTGVPGFNPIPSTTRSPTPTATNGIATPTPIQSGMVGNCDAFHFVVEGDGCAIIASKYGISLSQFYSWNTGVGSNCGSLWKDVYVCVSIIGVGPSSTIRSTTSTKPTNGIATPSPVQSGIASNCDAFHFVVDGDGCAVIASKYGISLSQFYSWNPAVGNSCGSLWKDVYVCVSIIGVGPSSSVRPTTSPKPTSTKPTNGIATPTPIQNGMSGMTKSCKTFKKVVDGDGCAAIAQKAGISLANFYKWNPGVGNDCQTLWKDNYVCIAIL
ncbi:hypothetical protein B0J11DRAFT_464848 [Dendryphion nanum]|uniref:LysM domain-containing protein n=1 Tax=Dendryphion nanum TaxID=256645 RepID=A0A9P9IJQ3_9PLEO|nr:hypothetical protein B0J11DRAFT_464848 [Dendryphion nanum]